VADKKLLANVLMPARAFCFFDTAWTEKDLLDNGFVLMPSRAFCFFDIIWPLSDLKEEDMLELADRHDLGSFF